MAKTTENELIDQFDSYGTRIQDWLSEEERTRTWLAKKLGISHPSLLDKMKDNQKWKQSELISMGMFKRVPVW